MKQLQLCFLFWSFFVLFWLFTIQLNHDQFKHPRPHPLADPLADDPQAYDGESATARAGRSKGRDQSRVVDFGGIKAVKN
jgi:hypothetical protein